MSKNGNLRCRIEKKYEEDFKKLAGGKPSELLYELVIKHLKKNNVEINSESGGEVELKFNPILNCRLRQNELVKVNEVLQAESKKPSEFLLGLVRARINKSPHFSKDELNELRQSNKQLVAIGRNLNHVLVKSNRTLFLENFHS
ncbi:MAG: hypothetical protein KZQ57_04185 [gamma proteobacterium symbiont of Lucinoma myriamae]|nr:hypothetical protein [gamma proteobacterium symbiont of Lucinoma myriamae]